MNFGDQLIKPLSNWLEQPFTQAAYTFDYVYRFRIFARNSIDIGFREVFRKNWSRQEINRKRVIQVIRVTVRILLLPRMQWVMIQVIEG